ncbi:adenylyltransferase/cytidyltransferase family protein [Sphingomonas sp. UYEF23]|uniref:adenylyltransferase/cytidyltransferase family protein n=1 Tax=Sphingomonas sp. UYEF23 TaxID=1756408 RepID=UPI003396131F
MSISDKIVSAPMLTDVLVDAGRPLVFTNGVFDLLHRGHVEYLSDARALGGALIVGLNSDVSARLLGKGADRPINRQEDRAVMLAALSSVTFVCLFDERTPLRLLEQARPHIYVKGGDYDVEQLAETALVRSWGGRAQAIALRDGYSTTNLVHRIRACST